MIIGKKSSPRTMLPQVDVDKCLAKTEARSNCVVPGMSVEEHCILSGAVSKVLQSILSVQRSVGLFPNGFDLIVSLHDIGKVSKPFQSLIYKSLTDKSSIPDFVSINDTSERTSINHAQIGSSCLFGFLNKTLKVEIDEADWDSIAWIVGSHHGKNPKSVYLADDPILGGSEYNEARLDLIKHLEKHFGTILPRALAFYEKQFLSGLTVVSDWISSARTRDELLAYGYKKLAMKAVEDAGYSWISVKKNLSFECIFGFSPNYMQAEFIKTVKGPGVYTIEVEMGKGKTEAALYAVYSLISKGVSNGMYFALPTKVTSMTIHERVNKFLEVVTENSSKARLLFRDSYLYLNGWGGEISPGKEWFDSGKRSILAPFGVGTIDQALMSVINVKHSSLRAFGLSGKVVIIDELHSYDAYTGTLICELVNRVRELGGTVIVLSATLNIKTKKALFQDCNVASLKYPLISSLIEGHFVEKPLKTGEEKVVEIVHLSNSDALENTIASAVKGAKVLWIENTVGEAQDVYSIIASRLAGTSVEVGLLHSRYIQEDRERLEKKWLSVFGKGTRENTHGAVLVGTQVLEQSLDIDSDLLVSRIAPIDMVLQRIGRLWRHRQNDGTRVCSKPVCIVIHPSMEEVLNDIDEAFGNSSFVYSSYVLYRSLKSLERITSISLPSSIRKLIDVTYDDSTSKEESDNKGIMRSKSELCRRISEMKQCANQARNMGDVVSDDECAKTRFNEERTSSLLVLSSIDEKKQTICFLDGTSISVHSGASKEKQIIIESHLKRNTLNVMTKSIPSEAFVGKTFHLLDDYFFWGEDYRSMGILLKKGGFLTDIYGNKIETKKVDYDSVVGYSVSEGCQL